MTDPRRVDENTSTDDIRITREMVLPEFIAEDDTV